MIKSHYLGVDGIKHRVLFEDLDTCQQKTFERAGNTTLRYWLSTETDSLKSPARGKHSPRGMTSQTPTTRIDMSSLKKRTNSSITEPTSPQLQADLPPDH